MARTAVTVLAGALLVFSRVFGLSLVLPGLRAHAATMSGDAVLAGAALGGYAVTLALMQVPMGMLSDRIGRTAVLWLATALFVGGSIWAAFAGDIWTLILARLVQGTGAVSSVAMALVGESVPVHRRTVGMAVVGIAAGGGFMLGLIAGPPLEPVLGMRGLFLVVAAVGALAMLPVAWVRPGPAAEDLGHPGRVGAATMALAVTGFTANVALMAVMFHAADAGAPLVWTLLVALVAMLVVSREADRRGWGWPALVPALAALAGGAPMLILLEGPAAFVGGAVFFSGHASLSAMLPSLVSRAAGRRGGRGHGVQSLLAHPGSFVGAMLAGVTVDAGHPELVFAAVALLVAGAAAALAWTARTSGMPQPSSETPPGTP